MKSKLFCYWSNRWIMVLDLFLSCLSTLVSFLMVSTFMVSSLPKLGFINWMLMSLLASFVSFYAFGTHHNIIRHMRIHDMWKNAVSVICKVFIIGSVLWLWVKGHGEVVTSAVIIYLLLDFLATLVANTGIRVGLLVCYEYVQRLNDNNRKSISVVIYGTDEKSVSILSFLNESSSYHVRGFLTYGSKKRHQRVSGKPVYYFSDAESLSDLKRNKDIRGIIFSKDEDAKIESNRLIGFATEEGLRMYMSQGIDKLDGNNIGKIRHHLREIKIEDLLGRPEIRISMNEIISGFRGKTVMVTGAAGSIGSELCRQLAGFSVGKLILFDNAETAMHNLRLELEERFPLLKFIPVIGDVRQQQRLDFAFSAYKPRVVFHAAAYKHVPLMEENPCEAVLVNVIGSRNVADFCLQYGVDQMVMISTDKAVNPTNVMGCSKRLAEIYVQSLGQAMVDGEVKGHTKFVTTRFGNVLGSNGSVIPRFREQISKGGPVTVTHPDITRFFMTIPEACRLVMEAATMTDGNQIFVFDMGESVKISTLAKRMIELAGFEVDKDIRIEYTGLRPGEKLYEEVLASSENTQTTDHEKIRIAEVREYGYSQARQVVEELESLSRTVNIVETVKLLKHTVPEFKSKNSRFEVYDKVVEI